MPETIDLLLKELKLPAFNRHYQRHQEQAIENRLWSCPLFIGTL